MEIAPIIMTRTFYKDYNHNFNIKPDDFFSEDISNLIKYILSASKDPDNLKYVRWFILNAEKHQVLGFIGTYKDIFTQCKASLKSEEQKDSQELLKDDKGRSIWGFIGIVIKDYKNHNKGKYIIPSPVFLWRIFLENMKENWKSTSVDSKPVPYRDYDNLEKIEIGQIKPNYEFHNKKIYELNQVRDYELFKYYLTNREENFSFCSNISFYNDVIESPFSVLTTTPNNIFRLKELEEDNETLNLNNETAEKEEAHKKFQEEFPNLNDFFYKIFDFFKKIFSKKFEKVDSLDELIKTIEKFCRNQNVEISIDSDKENKLEITLVRK